MVKQLATEHPLLLELNIPVEHKLRVVVRLDIDRTSAILNVTGCLTESSCPALFPIIRRAGALIGGLAVDVVLLQARHIDQPGLDLLNLFSADPRAWGFDGDITISVPAYLPMCPALEAARQMKLVAA